MQEVLDDERPVVWFAGRQPVQVDLRERGLCAAHASWGQVNVEPGVWAPQWVALSKLLEYPPGGAMSRDVLPAGRRRLPVAFSMMWGVSADDRFTHITDFTPLSPTLLAACGVLEWARLHPTNETPI